ncbi:hypothetical protein rsdtw13_16050 [Clostridium sp. TW13]|uniref:Uncharacterized protein n=1 Tax=Inconstantimicrobium mannanitabidum TaxID=1604901 RepID=A0ACB5RC32_9CLOT|nr:hypothetical protein rsdtw13_16050 [Clostridium sp. TW13]
MNLEECVGAFIENFPEHEQTYREHIDFCEELFRSCFLWRCYKSAFNSIVKGK